MFNATHFATLRFISATRKCVMKPFDKLTARGQQRRLRQLGLAALDRYDLAEPQLQFVNHGENTTFRLDTDERTLLPPSSPFVNGRYLLRIHGASYNSPAEINSELMWLHALRQDMNLAVPEPLLNRAGQFAGLVESVGVPEPRTCSVLRWMRGAMHSDHPQPHHVKKLGRLVATLHEHARHWQPPADFTRRRWDWHGMFGDNAHFGADTATVWAQIPAQYRDSFEAVAERCRNAMNELGESPITWGLVHADLHLWNVLYADGEARAIDFDDCGWAFWVYDLAVILSRWRFTDIWPTMRDTLLHGYAEIRPFPADQLAYLDTFMVARKVSVMMWVVGKAIDDPSFRPYVAENLEETAQLIEQFLADTKRIF